MDTKKLAHKIVDIVDKYIDAGPDDETYQVDYYHAIEDVKAELDKELKNDQAIQS